MSPRIVKTCFFKFGKSGAQLREGACLGDTSKENDLFSDLGLKAAEISWPMDRRLGVGEDALKLQPLPQAPAASKSPPCDLQDGSGVQQAWVILKVSLLLAGL